MQIGIHGEGGEPTYHLGKNLPMLSEVGQDRESDLEEFQLQHKVSEIERKYLA